MWFAVGNWVVSLLNHILLLPSPWKAFREATSFEWHKFSGCPHVLFLPFSRILYFLSQLECCCLEIAIELLWVFSELKAFSGLTNKEQCHQQMYKYMLAHVNKIFSHVRLVIVPGAIIVFKETFLSHLHSEEKSPWNSESRSLYTKELFDIPHNNFQA